MLLTSGRVNPHHLPWRAVCILASALLGVALFAALPPRPGIGAQAVSADRDQMGFSGLVSIGSRNLFVRCEGSGSPVVILEGGYGGGVSDWANVQPAVAQHTHVCSYDRASVGASDLPTSGPHTARQASIDLKNLLDALGIDEPVVLAGFSIGGLLARYHATSNPEAVARLVLIDPTPPVWAAMDLAGLPIPARTAKLMKLSGMDPNEPELLDVLEVSSEVFSMSASRVPVSMVTSGIKSMNPGMVGDDHQYLMTRLQNDQARELDAGHEVAARCTHYIPIQCPETAIDPILRMVEQVQGTSSREVGSIHQGMGEAGRPRRQIRFTRNVW